MNRFSLIFAIFCFANMCFAQANLEVTLLGEDKSTPVANDTVFVVNPAINYSVFGVTNQKGRAYFKQLPTAGMYYIFTRSADGAISAEEKDQILGENSDLTLILIKEAIAIADTKILGNNIRINSQTATVISELAHHELKQIPGEARDLMRILLRLPNVASAASSFPEAPFLSINGSSGANTNYLVEGMDNTDRIYGGPKYALASSVTQNVYVQTNSYGVEFGGASGTINTTTRSGTNEHTGEIGVLIRPGFLDGATPFAKPTLLGNLSKEGYSRYQLTYNGGGCFKKDKFFYFVGSEHAYEVRQTRLKSDILGINEVTNGLGRNNIFTGRVDYVWNKNWRSALMLNWGLYHIEKTAEGVIFPSAASVLDKTSQLYTLKNTFIRDNFAMESNLQFGTMAWNYDRAKIKGDNPQVILKDSANQTVGILGNPGYIFKSDETTFQIQQKLKWYLKGHKVRAGLELTSSLYQRTSGGNGGKGNYTVQLNTAQFNELKSLNKGSSLTYTDIPSNALVQNYEIELRNNPFLGQQTIYSAYLEDVWEAMDKLTLIGGLRYDYDNLSARVTGRGDFDNIAPRISANYQLNKKIVIRGAAGVYYERLPFVIAFDAMSKNNDSKDFLTQLDILQKKAEIPVNASINDMVFAGNLAASETNVGYLQGSSALTLQVKREKAFLQETRVFNPNGYKNPYTYQFSLGFQHQIDKRHIFTLDVVHNQSYNLARLRELNAPSAYTGSTPRSTDAADSSRPVPIYLDANRQPFAMNGEDTLRGISRNITMTEMAGRAVYTALSFNYQKEKGNDKYAYRFNYTLSSLMNNTEDPNFRAADNNNYDKEWAVGLNDRTHAINLLFYYYPTKQLSASLTANAQSGQPINYISASDLNGDGFSATPRPYFGNALAIMNPDRTANTARNSGRLPWSYTFDCGVQYDIQYNKKSRDYGVTLRLDVLNILNTPNVSGYAANSLWSNQYQSGGLNSFTAKSYAPPRQFQLTALWNW